MRFQTFERDDGLDFDSWCYPRGEVLEGGVYRRVGSARGRRPTRTSSTIRPS